MQTLIQESKSKVLDKDELEYRDNTIRMTLLVSQHSNFDVEIILLDIQKQIIGLKLKGIE